MNSRVPAENSDTVSLVCALLVRYPEVASIRCTPGEGTVRFSFAVSARLDRAAQQRAIDEITAHVDGLLALSRGAGDVRVECESDRAMSFVHVVRDLETFSKDELTMLAGYFTGRFGEALVRMPVEDVPDEDAAAQDELAEIAVEALRDPGQSKSLLGFREEKHVMVYFLKAQKKAKASARR